MLCKYYSPVHRSCIWKLCLFYSMSTAAFIFHSMNETYEPHVCSKTGKLCVDSPTSLRLLPSMLSSSGAAEAQKTDRFLNHSWALSGKERHAEIGGNGMRNVSSSLLYAMIYDTMVVSDLIIRVYFPSERIVKVSNFAWFPFILLFYRWIFFPHFPPFFNSFFLLSPTNTLLKTQIK